MVDQSIFLWLHDRVAQVFELMNVSIFQFGTYSISLVEVFFGITITFILLKFIMFRH